VALLGPYKVQLKLNPDKPKIGNNQLIILIRNAQDQNVNDAQIEASAVMPAMGSMPEKTPKPITITSGSISNSPVFTIFMVAYLSAALL
jgi:Cu(I)/Ag(I) efflux system membrane fusion protein